mmetsp:Transcript_108119/g.232982  ORF Transcript_108119/g.232982 Transcript_108119/m.232982 type:complete len:252 (-) Transcript_108119:421-1176(-)
MCQREGLLRHFVRRKPFGVLPKHLQNRLQRAVPVLVGVEARTEHRHVHHVQREGVHGVVAEDMDEEADIVRPSADCLGVVQGRIPQRLHLLQGLLGTRAANLIGHEAENQGVEPLPVEALRGQETVALGHGGPSDPFGIFRVPVVVVVSPIAADLVVILPRAEPLLLEVHLRLPGLANHDAREEVHRRRARAEVARAVLDDVEAEQLLVQGRDAAQLLQQDPAHLAEAGGVAEHRDPGSELVLERGCPLGS